MTPLEHVASTRGTPVSVVGSWAKLAHGIAAPAESRATTGNCDAAFRILLEIEHLMYEANNLLNVAAVIRRESET